MLARAWHDGAGSGDAPLTIHLDSTICETHGIAKDGARHHGSTGARGYHPLRATAASTGDTLQKYSVSVMATSVTSFKSQVMFVEARAWFRPPWGVVTGPGGITSYHQAPGMLPIGRDQD